MFFSGFSPISLRFASRFLRIFDLDSGRELAKHKHGGWVISTRFSRDGELLASGAADKWLRIFQGEELARCQRKRCLHLTIHFFLESYKLCIICIISYLTPFLST